MGLLSLFSKPPPPSLMRLPSGSFTVDRNGAVLVSTLPRSFPQALQQDITERVLQTFRDAQEAHVPVTELVVQYASLKLTARDMRGGAIVFLTPINLMDPAQ
jgi:hypothetical protein